MLAGSVRFRKIIKMLLWVSFVFLATLTPPFAGNFLDTGTLYEGGPCRMEDGRPGICITVTKCPLRMIEIEEGSRGADSAGRCGFEAFTELVCCVQNDTNPERRPADHDLSSATVASTQPLPRVTFGPLHISLNRSRTNREKIWVGVGNGFAVELPEFPYAAALGYRNKTGQIVYLCGGSLITEYHVLTAAHCVYNNNDEVLVEVRLGDLNLERQTASTQRIPVKSVVRHEAYSKIRYYHDVAVITLERMAILSGTVSTICLPTNYTWTLQSRSAVRQRTSPSLIVIGWGAFELGHPLSPNLIKSPSLSLVDRTICSDMYRNALALPYEITPELLCAVDRNISRRSGACVGDSGGPLVQQSPNGDTILGITAFGQGCVGSVPGIYTAVYPYIEWIEKQVWGENVGGKLSSKGTTEGAEMTTVVEEDKPFVFE